MENKCWFSTVREKYNLCEHTHTLAHSHKTIHVHRIDSSSESESKTVSPIADGGVGYINLLDERGYLESHQNGLFQTPHIFDEYHGMNARFCVCVCANRTNINKRLSMRYVCARRKAHWCYAFSNNVSRAVTASCRWKLIYRDSIFT